MNYQEVIRISREIKKREDKLSRLADQADTIQMEIDEQHKFLQMALNGDMSYMEFEEVEETPETLENL